MAGDGTAIPGTGSYRRLLRNLTNPCRACGGYHVPHTCRPEDRWITCRQANGNGPSCPPQHEDDHPASLILEHALAALLRARGWACHPPDGTHAG
jgi:hypothetical protein